MEARIETKAGGATVVHLSGELRGQEDDSLLPVVEKLLDGPSPRVVIDLAGVSYVSSAGLGDLVRLASRANSLSAHMVLSAPSPFVAGVFKATRLDRFFEIHATLDAALAAVSK